MYIGKVPKKRFVFLTQENSWKVPDTCWGKQAICLTTRSGLLLDAVFCTKALTHCTTRTLNWQAQPLDISVWVCVLKSWRVLSERLKQRCHGYPRPTSSQSRYRTQALTAKEKEFLMISLTWIQMVHNTSVLPQLKLHPEKAPPVSQQSSVFHCSPSLMGFFVPHSFCCSQFRILRLILGGQFWKWQRRCEKEIPDNTHLR